MRNGWKEECIKEECWRDGGMECERGESGM